MEKVLMNFSVMNLKKNKKIVNHNLIKSVEAP